MKKGLKNHNDEDGIVTTEWELGHLTTTNNHETHFSSIRMWRPPHVSLFQPLTFLTHTLELV